MFRRQAGGWQYLLRSLICFRQGRMNTIPEGCSDEWLGLGGVSQSDTSPLLPVPLTPLVMLRTPHSFVKDEGFRVRLDYYYYLAVISMSFSSKTSLRNCSI